MAGKILMKFVIIKLTKLANLIIFMTYTLSMFNTGQITLPKMWREKQKTKKFIAEETPEGLLIKPISKDETIYYEGKNGFGIYCEKGLDVGKMIKTIEKLNGQDT